MLGIMNQWIYDKDPFEGIRFESAIRELKEDLEAKKPVFQNLLSKYFVSNNHRVTVNMVPNKDLEKESLQAEEQKLSNIKESMSTSDLELIVDNTKTLQAMQSSEDSPEAKASIPKLSMDDLERDVKDIPIKVHEDAHGSILTHDLTTSGILYADIGFDLSGVEQEDLCLLPLFSRLLKESGTKTMDEVSLTRWIGSETGGVGISYFSDLKHVSGKVSNPDDALFYLMLRGKSTIENVPVLFDIFKQVLLESKVGDSQKRSIEILKETKTRAETSIITSGHSFAATRLSSSASLVGYFNEATGGLSYVRSLTSLIEQAENDWEKFGKRLENIRNAIIRKNGYVVNLTGEETVTNNVMPHVQTFLGSLPEGQAPRPFAGVWDRSKIQTSKSEGFTMASQVNYVVKGASILNPSENVKGSFSVVTSFLSKGLLWEKVRVMGGAYGGFARFGEASGRVIFLSYRDPNLSKTLDIYDSASSYLRNADISQEDITQTVIGCTGDLDTPMTADQKGFTSMIRFLNGESIEDRQRYRDEVLGTSLEDFRMFAEKLATLSTEGKTVVFGSESALELANKELPKDKVLEIARAV